MGTGLPWACRAPAPSLPCCCRSQWATGSNSLVAAPTAAGTLHGGQGPVSWRVAFSAALHEPHALFCLSLCGDSSLGCEHPLCPGASGCFCSCPASSQRLRCSGAGGCSGCLHRTLPVPAMGGSVAGGCAMCECAARGCAMGGCAGGGCAIGGSAAGVPCKPGSFPVPT